MGIISACAVPHPTLIVPGFNDDPDETDALSAWLAGIDPAIPYHLTRFFPSYRMTDRLPTEIGTLEHLKRIAQEHLQNVNLGNC